MKQFKVQDITKISLCVALLCATSYLIIPLPFTPIVISFHTIMVNVIGLILKPKEAACTILIYLLMGCIGLPVFSAGTAGPAKLFGPTGGFYFGFLAAVTGISLCRKYVLAAKGKKNSLAGFCIATIVIGLPLQHLFGVWFMYLHNGGNLFAAFLTVSLPFLMGDIIKCVMASVISVALNRVLR